MMGNYLPTSEYWHAKAQEALARASEMRDAEAVHTMKTVAELYERMAQRAAPKPPEPPKS
jgi:hypothetical protein